MGAFLRVLCTFMCTRCLRVCAFGTLLSNFAPPSPLQELAAMGEASSERLEGKRVLLHSLQARPDFNGLTGTVCT